MAENSHQLSAFSYQHEGSSALLIVGSWWPRAERFRKTKPPIWLIIKDRALLGSGTKPPLGTQKAVGEDAGPRAPSEQAATRLGKPRSWRLMA